MILAHKLAGFIAAKALWSVKETQSFTPSYGFLDESETQSVEELGAETLVDAVKLGTERLSANPDKARYAALVFVGTLPIGKGEYDALFLELRDYSKPDAKVVIAVPYSPAREGKAFRVHKLKVVNWTRCEGFNKDHCLGAIFKGIEGHEQGFRLWRTSFDGSV